jgi:predicted transcriptional regulator YdeE
MSVEITKVYKQDVPALRFIGKKYGDNDRVDGMFGKVWGDWFQNGWFDIIIKQTDKDLKTLYEDGDAYIGLMRCKDGEPFEYWIGVFMPEGTQVPEGFEYRDFPKATLCVCWLYGKEDEVYKQEEQCVKKLEEEGYQIANDEKAGFWVFERYGCPRFTTPDGNGKIILDICWYAK